jgi:putative transposase
MPRFCTEGAICRAQRWCSMLVQPGAFADQRTPAGRTHRVAQAVAAEVAEFLAEHADLKTEDGWRRIVRPGYLRKHMTGTGFVSACQPQLRDREVADDSPGRISLL